MNQSFYTYIHTRADDGKVFYVGKGKGARAFSPRGRNPFWHRTVQRHGLKVDIAARWESEADAFEHERFLICCMRDMGQPLSNLTDGGEGPSGYRHSPEARASYSAKRTGKRASKETREKMSASAKARGPHPNSIASLKGRPVSEETRRKMSMAQKGREVPAERRAKISATLKGRPLPEEVRKKIAASLQRPERRASVSAQFKGRPWSEARRAAQKGGAA